VTGRAIRAPAARRTPVMDIHGSRFIVAGATGVLGEAIARSLATEGAELALAGRDRERLERLGEELEAPTAAFDARQIAGCGAVVEVLSTSTAVPQPAMSRASNAAVGASSSSPSSSRRLRSRPASASSTPSRASERAIASPSTPVAPATMNLDPCISMPRVRRTAAGRIARGQTAAASSGSGSAPRSPKASAISS